MSDVFDAKAFLKTVTSQPGVYRMYDAGGTVIYVGKAKDLKKRLSSYFRSNLASRKTEALVALIAQIDVTVTHTETEALLLEHNYIKLYQPRYNVMLKDDKTYPWIVMKKEPFSRIFPTYMNLHSYYAPGRAAEAIFSTARLCILYANHDFPCFIRIFSNYSKILSPVFQIS